MKKALNIYIKPESLEGVTIPMAEQKTAEFGDNQFAVIIRDEKPAAWLQLMARGYFDYVHLTGPDRILLRGKIRDIYSITAIEVNE